MGEREIWEYWNIGWVGLVGIDEVLQGLRGGGGGEELMFRHFDWEGFVEVWCRVGFWLFFGGNSNWVMDG